MPGTDLLRPLASRSSFSCHPRHRERSPRQSASQSGRWWRGTRWKFRQRWCSPVPGQAKLLPVCAIPHTACPSSSSCITTTLSYFSLKKGESQRKFLWKPTSTCSAPWLSIDWAMRRRKESRLSPSSCRTLQCDQNSDTQQCNSKVQTQRNFFQYGGRSRNKMALRFAYGKYRDFTGITQARLTLITYRSVVRRNIAIQAAILERPMKVCPVLHEKPIATSPSSTRQALRANGGISRVRGESNIAECANERFLPLFFLCPLPPTFTKRTSRKM